MYDEMNDKMLTSTEVRFDSNYVVVSNGRRVRVDTNNDGSLTWRYAMTKPHAGYLLMLAIGDYAVTKRTSKGGVPLEWYSYPDRPDQIEPTYQHSIESMDWMEEEVGIDYPWEVYRQVPVADFIYGAMENTTATIFGDFYMANEREWLDRSYIGTNVHELTHQWFGDLITARSKTHHWLQESFATYYPYLYTKVYDGEDAYQWKRRGMQNSALAAGKKDRKPIVHPNAGSSRYYPKGASVLHMMRYVYGHEQVRRVIQHYLRHHGYQNVETNDLYLAFQDTLGLTPHWFFDQWLYRGGEPHYKVSHHPGQTMSLEGSISTTVVDIDQIHHVDDLTRYFRMPIQVQVHYEDETYDSARVWVDGPHTTAVINNPQDKNVAFVLFDPGSHVLKTVTFKKPFDELRAQLQRSPNMIDRYDALVALGDIPGRDTELLELLNELMDDETFHAMRSEAVKIAKKLYEKGLTKASQVVKKGMEDDAVEVRKTAIRQFDQLPGDLQDAAEDLLDDRSYEVISIAVTKLCNSFPDDAEDYLEETAEVKSPFARVEIARLEEMAQLNDTTALTQLADLTSQSFDFWTRGNAMKAFKRLGILTPEAARGMLNGLWSTNGRLAGTSKEVLESLMVHERWSRMVREVGDKNARSDYEKKQLKSLF